MSWIDEIVAGSTVKSKIGWQGELEFSGASEDDRAGRVVRFRLIRRPEEHLTAHPFSKFSRRRGKSAGSRFSTSIVTVANEQTAYNGEVMLLNWSDGPQGSTVALMLDQEGSVHPFLGFTRGSRQAPGSRFMAVFVEIGDDELPVEPERPEPAHEAEQKARVHQLTSNAAAILLKAPRFHDWLREHVADKVWSEKDADVWMKRVLKIDSKRELDEDGPAPKAFVALRARFSAWLEEQDGPYRG